MKTYPLKCTIGELLYVLGNYEKGRFSTVKFTTCSEKKRLRESLNIMSLMVDFLDDGRTEHFDLMDEFVKKNHGTIFSISFDDFLHSQSTCNDQESHPEAVQLMRTIIGQINDLNNKKIVFKQDRIAISYLLRAFHNLPKVYIKSEEGHSLLEDTDAISYARDWISKIN